MKHGELTAFLCPRCMTPKDSLSEIRHQHCVLHLEVKCNFAFHTSPPDVAGRAAFEILFIHPAPPEFSKFPFMGSRFSNYLYYIFYIDPMLNLFLGVSKLVKKCTMEQLRGEHFSRTVISFNGQLKPFPSVRQTIMSSLSYFLISAENESVGYKLKANFSKSTAPNKLDGLFQKIGLAGMLEANNYSGIDRLLQFLGAVIDRGCGEPVTAPITSLFTKDTIILNTLYCQNMYSGWSENDLQDLYQLIQRLKHGALTSFRNYQQYAFNTKWHMLDQVIAVIERPGEVCYMMVGFY